MRKKENGLKSRCGKCTECCTLLDVPGTTSAWEKCRYANKHGTSCRIYSNRPKACRNFNCLWLLNGLAPELRPDKCGVVFQLYTEDKTVVATDEGKWNRSGPSRLLIAQMLKDGYVVWLVTRTGKHLLLPQGITEKEAREKTARAWNRIWQHQVTAKI